MADRLPIVPPSIQGMEYHSPLGRGGFADVLLYRQTSPDRKLAVKVFVKKLRGGTADETKFMSEANKLAKFSDHPNIVTLIEAKVSRDGYPYLAMELCPKSLGSNWRGNPLPLETVLDVGVQIACALEMVHQAGIVHRDIKPSNILLSTLGVPKLSDFGIADLVATPESGDQVAMSLPWSAPEVVSMKSLGTPASDIWSLGATLYSLLAGRSPFEVSDSKQNTNEQLSKRIIKAIYTTIPRAGIPSIVDAVLNKSMFHDPKQRFGSMAEFAMALNDVQKELQFPVTRLTIPTDLSVILGDDDSEKYPCGHKKVKVESSGVYVEPVGGSRRRDAAKTVDPDECPICAESKQFLPAKRKFKPGPLFWALLGTLIISFGIGIVVLGSSGV